MANTPKVQIAQQEKNASSVPPRERILRAAGDLFYQYGIHAVSVDAIAAAARSNKMTLYRHFPSKEILIAASIFEQHKATQAMWESLHNRHINDPLGEFDEWLEIMYRYIESPDEPSCKLMDKAIDIRDAQHPGRLALEEVKQLHINHLTEMCRAAGFKNHEELALSLHILFEGAREGRSVGGERLAELLPKMVSALSAPHLP
ncbi:TetR/AcrR family transcriptional regulator [Pseudomonas aeruginosa]|uniref:TetR/AcrR family transcriptional regulator n=1 Tax=Pseudomonas aeruginosa TaxID=287 RepID=UPI000FC42839|nr:TetR/AcrR family transcriptional regulator [Pseudomonas aeruginosa]NPT07730.1 TetR/AcrR family transcriptional regulator [Pseudomonas aeruginosa]RUC20293.1 TetR/AcrR family transcriptional regulator [Pseudomonas aeruginosa]TEC80879.1 TetR/AcrR family transcriptional regulator [Pseudomonas aeruginosa]HBN8252429.1 TetR/AcrR family transcriptional regulator [Pseudomonas aeruginosa]HBN8477547.1 TetR/AcrR family transcriptional regulator [Pseudomonas aeruginosa]